jgi:hypothetical protein
MNYICTALESLVDTCLVKLQHMQGDDLRSNYNFSTWRRYRATRRHVTEDNFLKFATSIVIRDPNQISDERVYSIGAR